VGLMPVKDKRKRLFNNSIEIIDEVGNFIID
jgi:hypothetical protein